MGMVVTLPTSVALSYAYNLGSFLGMALTLQLFSGLILLMNYSSSMAFDSIMFIMNEVHYGWLVKVFHSNNASLIFLLLYLHLWKNMVVGGYRLRLVWASGLLMFVMIMAAGFSGYALVGSQMSWWAVIVITSLLGVVPYIGESLTFFVWGGFSVSWVTLQLMLVIHFVVPFLVMGTMVAHLFFLHATGSTSPVGVHGGVEKTQFFPFFWVKDGMNVLIYMLFFVGVLLYPYSLGEVELFEDANPMVSPVHIVPEWYFLAVYAILRSVPSKGMGVLLMVYSILILFVYPSFVGYITLLGNVSVLGGYTYVVTMVLLMYLGAAPIAYPYTVVSVLVVMVHLLGHLVVFIMNYLNEYYNSVGDQELEYIWYTQPLLWRRFY